MKISEMPDWVLKYKTKGYTVRLNAKSCYCLYRVWSEYVPGSHPKTHYEYVGVIKEDEGLVTPDAKAKEKAKAESIGHYYLEYGYSELLYRTFKRDLQRSLYGASGRRAEIEIRLAIFRHIFGSDEKELLSLSWWTAKNKEEALKIRENLSDRRIKGIDGKLEVLLRAKIVDEKDRFLLKEWLLLAVVRDDSDPPSPLYSPKVKALAQKWRLELQ